MTVARVKTQPKLKWEKLQEIVVPSESVIELQTNQYQIKMKKFIAISLAVLAIASIAFVGVYAATKTAATAEVAEVVDLSDVTVTAYNGNTQLLTMSGPDCAAVFYVLPTEVKAQISAEWDKFTNVAKSKGVYSGVKYSLEKDKFTFQYGGYKVIATNLSSEEIHKIISKIE